MKFATKLTTTVVCLSLIAVPALGAAIFYLTKNIIQQNITTDQVRQTRAILNNIDRSLFSAYQGIELIGNDSHLELFLKTVDDSTQEATDGHSKDRFATDFRNLIRLTGPWDLINIIDRQGNIVYSSERKIAGKNIKTFPIDRNTHFAALAGRLNYSDLVESKFTTRPTVIFSAPVRNRHSRKILGTVNGYFSWPIILQILDRTHTSNQIILFNRVGEVIATPSEYKDQILKTSFSNHNRVKQLFDGNRVSSGIDQRDANSDTILSSAVSQDGYLGYRGNDWGLLLGVPTDIAFASVRDLAGKVTIAIILVVVMMVIIIYLFAKRISKPIEALTKSVLAIGNGKINATIKINTGDELETLGEAFNQMVISRDYAEAELVSRERLAVMGQLTATVSHELRNPLGTINNCLVYLKKYGQDESDLIEESIDNAMLNVQRCNIIITDLLSYSRQQPIRAKIIAIDQWLVELLDEYDFAPQIVMHRKLEAGVEASIDVELLRRGIINLLDNACQAIVLPDEDEKIAAGESGSITVSTQVSKDQLEISVSDTGCGIEPEDIAHIFEPFYSSKSFGTGLGLPTVEKVIEQHGGRVSAESELGQGTVLTLHLPIAVK